MMAMVDMITGGSTSPTAASVASRGDSTFIRIWR